MLDTAKLWHGAGSYMRIAYNAGNFVGASSMVWTVDSGDMEEYSCSVYGEIMTLWVRISASSISGTPANNLQITIPGGFTAARRVNGAVGMLWDNNVPVGGFFDTIAVGSGIVAVKRTDNANFNASTNQTYVYGQVQFPIQ
jgi:hypothetical protein